jgi:hypothetical protein
MPVAIVSNPKRRTGRNSTLSRRQGKAFRRAGYLSLLKKPFDHEIGVPMKVALEDIR